MIHKCCIFATFIEVVNHGFLAKTIQQILHLQSMFIQISVKAYGMSCLFRVFILNAPVYRDYHIVMKMITADNIMTMMDHRGS